LAHFPPEYFGSHERKELVRRAVDYDLALPALAEEASIRMPLRSFVASAGRDILLQTSVRGSPWILVYMGLRLTILFFSYSKLREADKLVQFMSIASSGEGSESVVDKSLDIFRVAWRFVGFFLHSLVRAHSPELIGNARNRSSIAGHSKSGEAQSLETVIDGLCNGLRKTDLEGRISRTKAGEPLRLECVERALGLALDIAVQEAQLDDAR
jgi:hypothetical protein